MGFGNPEPAIRLAISQGTLMAESIYQDPTLQVLPFTPDPNQWLYISIAGRFVSVTEWAARFFYKRLGGNLTQWASWDSATTWTDNLHNAIFGLYSVSGSDPLWDGLISGCTLHSFQNDDFSDVVYPAEVLEPGYIEPPPTSPAGTGSDSDGSHNLLYEIARNTAGSVPVPGDSTFDLLYKIAKNTAGTAPVFGDRVYDLYYKIAQNMAGTAPRVGDRVYDLVYKIAANTSKGADGNPSFGDNIYDLLRKVAGNTSK